MEICGQITRGVIGPHRLCLERPDLPHEHVKIGDYLAVSLRQKIVRSNPDGSWRLVRS